MTPPLYISPDQFLGDDQGRNGVINLLDLNHSAIACFTFPSLPTLPYTTYSSWPIPMDKIRNPKRLKQASSGDHHESITSNGNLYNGGGSSMSSINSWYSLPRLQFRDHIWAYNQRYLAIEAMEEATTAMMGGEEHQDEEEGSGDEIKLVQQLVSCAEAVACRDKVHASILLSELKANALVFGTSFQRVASCFVQGLSDRLALVQPLGAVGVTGLTAKTMVAMPEKDEALHLVYEMCPQIQFGHFVANALILEAFEGETCVHVVDLGMSLGLPHGHQWRRLIKSLTNHAGQPISHLRITGVGNCIDRLEEIGYC